MYLSYVFKYTKPSVFIYPKTGFDIILDKVKDDTLLLSAQPATLSTQSIIWMGLAQFVYIHNALIKVGISQLFT